MLWESLLIIPLFNFPIVYEQQIIYRHNQGNPGKGDMFRPGCKETGIKWFIYQVPKAIREWQMTFNQTCQQTTGKFWSLRHVENILLEKQKLNIALSSHAKP